MKKIDRRNWPRKNSKKAMLLILNNGIPQPKKMSHRFMSNLRAQDPQKEEKIAFKTMMKIQS
jgi:hypothetical protein